MPIRSILEGKKLVKIRSAPYLLWAGCCGGLKLTVAEEMSKI
jgi:hypothetical protein